MGNIAKTGTKPVVALEAAQAPGPARPVLHGHLVGRRRSASR